MGREVRRVPKDWEHPKYANGRFIPLSEGYREDFGFWLQVPEEHEEMPNMLDYMPEWPESQKTHLMPYENVSDGTPKSPAFETPELLARWLVDNGVSSFGNLTSPYEAWLILCKGNYAPSMVYQDGKLMSGVDALCDNE